MRYATAGLLALFVLSARVAAAPVPPPPPEPPLPEGAVARLGTTKFRTSGTAICLSADGTRAALLVGNGIDVLNLNTGAVVARLRDEKKLTHTKMTQEPHRVTFAFASSGKELVTAAGHREVGVWDAETGKFLRSIPGPIIDDFENPGRKAAGRVLSVFNCQLAEFVVCETWGGWQKLNVKTGEWTRIEGGYDRISDVSPDGRWVTDYTDMASVENYVGVTDTKSNKGVYAGESGGSYPFTSTPSPEGKLVACTTDESGAQVWDIATKKEVKLKGVNPKISHGVPRFTPDGQVLLVNMPSSVYDEKTPPHFARWDVTTGERLPDWKIPARVNSWAVDHKNNRLVVIAGLGVFHIDIATGKLIAPPDGFVGYTRPAISPDGKLAVVGDAAGMLRVWESPFTGKPRTLRESGEPVDDLVFSKDGKTLLVSHADRTASVWDMTTGKPTATFKSSVGRAEDLPSYRRTLLALSPDGKTLVGEANSQALWAWDTTTGKLLWKEETAGKGWESTISGCRPVFTPDGAAMYYGRPKGEVSKFDPRTGKELARLAAPVNLKAWVTRLAISPDGKQLAAHTYYNAGELVLFDLARGTAKWRQEFKLAEAVGGLAFAPDGEAVVTTQADGTIRGWKAADGKPAFTLRGPAGYLWQLQLTSDGTHAITDSPGATALVWKLK